MNIISKNRTEWDLKSPAQQFLFKAKVVFFSLFVGGGFGVFITEGLKRIVQFNLSYFISFPIGFFIGYLIFNGDLKGDIKESRERISNPRYIKFLTEIGLIKNTISSDSKSDNRDQ